MVSGPFERSKPSNISPRSTRNAFKTVRSHFVRCFVFSSVTFADVAQVLVKAGQRWFIGQIKLSVAVINGALICFAVALRHSTSAGLFAVALIQATSLTERLNWFFTTWVDVEMCVVAAERCV